MRVLYRNVLLYRWDIIGYSITFNLLFHYRCSPSKETFNNSGYWAGNTWEI